MNFGPGNRILADTSVEAYIERLFTSNKEEFGILLGQRGNNKNILFTMVKTPLDPEGELKSLDREWILEHARQVSRMLCGGIQTIGFYYYGDVSDIYKYQGAFHTILTGLAKLHNDITHQDLHAEDILDFVLLTIQNTKQYFTTNFKIQNNKVQSSKSSEINFKYLSNIQRFITYWPLNLEIIITPKKSLKSQIEKSLQKEFKLIIDSLGSIDGHLVKDESLSEKSSLTTIKSEKYSHKNQKNKKGKQKVKNEREKISEKKVNFYKSGFESLSSNFPEDGLEGEGILRIKGSVIGRAYFISEKPTNQQILNTLKLDLISTISNRLSLWYEEIEQQPDNSLYLLHTIVPCQWDLITDQIWSLPRRVFVNSHDTQISICDYILPMEEEDDFVSAVSERCSELLQLTNITLETIQQPEAPVKCTSGITVKYIQKKNVLGTNFQINKRNNNNKKNSKLDEKNSKVVTSPKNNSFNWVIPVLIVLIAVVITSFYIAK